MNHPLPKTLFPFIWHFLHNYKTAVISYILLASAAGFCAPFNSILIKHLINLLPRITDANNSILIFPASLIVINFFLFDNLTWRGITYIRAKFIPIIINKIVATLMDQTLKKSHQFYQDNLSGKISKQITNLSDGIEKIISTVTANFLRGTSLLLTVLITTYSVNPIFCLIMIVFLIVFVGSSLFMSKQVVSLSDAQASSESVVVGELVDAFSNQSNIRIFAQNSYENSRINTFLSQQQKAYTATYLYLLMLHFIQGSLIAIMIACCTYALIHLYSKNLVTVGDFALILGLSLETAYIMWFTMSEVDEFNKAVGRCKQSLISLMLPLEIHDSPTATDLNCTKGQITFDKVKFHYKGTEALFENKSVIIHPGQKVGLVGYSGGGKSTFVNLILRLYDITDGAILIDGQDIRTVTQDSLRTNIAMIPQDPILFHRSLMENIRYGRINASDDEVIEAAKKAHAHDFIDQLPERYNSLVGERGVKLSGGQRQRIAIARAILKNAPILILDEATSQLDSLTENLIQESLWHLMQNKTTMVIAHRLSTLLHMDRILVFNQGKIVEDGTHDELLVKNGLYQSLWDAQVGGFLGDKPFEEEI
jgi:ATP-binding cassette subfamily B protein